MGNFGDPYWPAFYMKFNGFGGVIKCLLFDNKILGFGIDQGLGFGMGH